MFGSFFGAKNYSTEFHKNLTNGLVTDFTARTDGRMWSPFKAFLFIFYSVKNAKNTRPLRNMCPSVTPAWNFPPADTHMITN